MTSTGGIRAWIGRHPLWSLWAIALLVRTLYVFVTGLDPYQMIDSVDYEAVARDLLAGKGYQAFYGNPFLRPPVYPFLLAGAYVAGGIVTLQVLQILLSATTVVLIGVVARLLHPNPAVTWVAALIATFHPWLFAFVGGIASETVFTFLWVAAAALLLLSARREKLALAALAGIVFGLACLTRANLLTIAPGVAAWLWWRTRSPVKPALFAFALAWSLLPFTVYNWIEGNGLVIASNGGGMSFYIGNNPAHTMIYRGVFSEEEWIRSRMLGPIGEAYIDCPDLECIYAMPMRQRDAFFYGQGLRYIREAPLDVLITDVKKLFHYWRPWVDPRVHSAPIVLGSGISFATLLVLAALGLWRMRKDAAAFALVVAVSATLTVMVWHVQLRYRGALLDPILIAVASAPVAYWLTSSAGGPIARLRSYLIDRRPLAERQASTRGRA